MTSCLEEKVIARFSTQSKARFLIIFILYRVQVVPRGSPVTRNPNDVDGNKTESTAVLETPFPPSANIPAASFPTSPTLPQTEHCHPATRGAATTPTTAAGGATRDRSNPMNSVARAARGWENDAPEVPLGMRHYPQRQSMMATFVGGGGGNKLFAGGGDTGSEEAKVNFFVRLLLCSFGLCRSELCDVCACGVVRFVICVRVRSAAELSLRVHLFHPLRDLREEVVFSSAAVSCETLK